MEYDDRTPPPMIIHKVAVRDREKERQGHIERLAGELERRMDDDAWVRVQVIIGQKASENPITEMEVAISREKSPDNKFQFVADICDALAQNAGSLVLHPPDSEYAKWQKTKIEGLRKEVGKIKRPLTAAVTHFQNAEKLSREFTIYPLSPDDPEPFTKEDVATAQNLVTKALRWEEFSRLYHVLDEMAPPSPQGHRGPPTNEPRDCLEIELAAILQAAGLSGKLTAQYIAKFHKMHGLQARPSEKSIEQRITKYKNTVKNKK